MWQLFRKANSKCHIEDQDIMADQAGPWGTGNVLADIAITINLKIWKVWHYALPLIIKTFLYMLFMLLFTVYKKNLNRQPLNGKGIP